MVASRGHFTSRLLNHFFVNSTRYTSYSHPKLGREYEIHLVLVPKTWSRMRDTPCTLVLLGKSLRCTWSRVRDTPCTLAQNIWLGIQDTPCTLAQNLVESARVQEYENTRCIWATMSHQHQFKYHLLIACVVVDWLLTIGYIVADWLLKKLLYSFPLFSTNLHLTISS
jgi:hypothetical protein